MQRRLTSSCGTCKGQEDGWVKRARNAGALPRDRSSATVFRTPEMWTARSLQSYRAWKKAKYRSICATFGS